MPTPIGTSFYLEAESGQLSGGFTIGADPSTSGGRYLQPPVGVTAMTQPGSARALYSVAIPTAATYIIWGRIHSPDAHHNTFWIQVDGGAWYLWRIATGDVWYWNRFHDNINYGTPLTFALNAGPHELLIANADDGVGLDRLYFTPNGDTPPGNNTPCNPPSSIEVGGACQKSCGAQGGNLCGAVPCMGYPTMAAYDCAVCCTHP